MKKMKTMRTNRFRLLTVLLAAVMLVALGLNAYAAQGNAVTQDGLTAQVFTDKDSYQTNESVNVTVRVDNHTGKDVFIRTEVEVPAGVTLAAESASYDAVLQDGQTFTTSGGVASAETAGSVPATGDNAHAGVWIILAVISAAGIIALFVYGKNKKTWLSVLLCLTMLGGLVTTALPVEAADIHGSVEASCTIQVDGEDAEVSATITYVIYNDVDNEEAEDVTESAESSESGSSNEATEPSEPTDSVETTETSEPSEDGGESGEASGESSEESSESGEASGESTEEGSESGEASSESTEEGSESGEESSESTEEGSESGEESSESTEESSESSEESSESTEESSESSEESSESGEESSESTEESGGTSDDEDSSEEESNVVFELTFDDLTSFIKDTDYLKQGGNSWGPIELTNEPDHTTGSGQSLKMAGRKYGYQRVKILNAFENAEIGETYIISAWIYSDTSADNVGIGIFGNTDPYVSDPYTKAVCAIEANKWTEVKLEFTYESEEIALLGVGQFSAKTVAETIYVDDVTITKSDVPKKEYTTLVPVTEREGKRPTPDVTYTGIGNTYDALIFYNREIDEDKLTSDEMFERLPSDPVVMADHEDMLQFKLLKGPEYTEVTVVEVDEEDGMPFEKAIRASVKEKTTYSYDTQLELESLDPSTYEDGDSMLIVFYMRTENAENEAATGQVQLIVEQEEAPNRKLLKENVTTLQGTGWKKVYLPFSAGKEFSRLCIRLGFGVQTVEFGGYQILNYGQDVPLENLPSDTIMDNSAKEELFIRDVDWRVDAWERIEEIRKGDINVVVKDEAGNVIPDAEITIDMYDHEFKWGTAVNSNLTKAGEFSDKYREAVSIFFNTAVSENSHKMARYLRDTTGAARSEVDTAKELGLKYYRGHTLIWDKPLSDTYDEETGQYISQNSITEELMRLELAGDEDAINDYIQNNVIAKMVGDFKGELCDWDVVNETLVNHQMVGTYGYSMMKNWFDWVKQYDPTVKKYINECRIVGVPENGTLDAFKNVLNQMVAAQVDFDGIGVQAHFSTYVSPKAFYDELVELAAYGKELKITEFDCSQNMHLQDEEAEASFVRDIMILAYSMEQMDGFLMWGFTDASHWLENAVLFDEDWNLKLSGQQYMDLVYNKWWTQETGITDENGTYSVKGYYGDYLITAAADGKTATVDVQCYKGDGNGNTVEIILRNAEDSSESTESSEPSESTESTEPGESTEESSESGEESSESTEESSESGEESSESSEESSESSEESSESTEESSESTEESSESSEESSESSEESSESGEESSESSEESSESGEESSESTEESGDISDDEDSSEEESNVVFELTFDDLTSFIKETDYLKQGGGDWYAALTSVQDHTTGSGQSLKMAKRYHGYHRVKILNAFEEAETGETYIVSAWIYSETAADNVGIGIFNRSDYKDNPCVKGDCDIEANKWTQVELEFTYSEGETWLIGVGQFNVDDTKVAKTIYVDDVTVTKKE